MRPIPIEDDWGEHYRKVVMAAPDNDLTNENIAPVEVFVGPTALNSGGLINTFFIKVLLEKEDLDRLAEGQHHFWLMIHGNRLQPFALAMEVFDG